jgi:hypothetical protein
MQRRLLFLLAMLALCCTTQIFAAPGIAFTLNSIKTNSDIIAGLPLPTGADLTLELPLGSTSTAFTLRAAAGYESRMILRSTATMFPIAEPPAIDGVNRFFWTNALAELGVKQYLLHKEHEQAWLFGLVRGRYENNSPSFPTTLFPDAQAVRSASGVGGIAFDSIRWLGKNVKKGVSAELSYEYSPDFANFSGTPADFGRANFTAKAFVPLSASNFATYLALYGVGDYALGSHIPHEVLTTFGGITGTKGIGDMVRGAQPWGYEAPAKTYVSAELRVAGPSMFRDFAIYPVGYLFADAAAYGSLYGSPLVDNSGMIASAGAGASVSVLNFLWLGAYAGWRLPVNDPLSAIYYGSAHGFFWNFTFVAHY